jgi:uncharacterized protein YndB with AHSA1/START domain
MTTIRARVVIDASPARVWDALSDIASHVQWMVDADAIRFTSARTSGKGTTFECDTRVGPFRLVDEMEVTAWRPRRRMAVRHVGVVRGKGAFTLRRHRGGRTTLAWTERLQFPWYLGGPFGGLVGGQLLAAIWRRNLRRFAYLVES